VDASVIRGGGGTQIGTWPFGYPEVRRWIWIQEFYQDDSDRLRMSFENDRWQNIKREYNISRRAHVEKSERTDALAVAMPPNTSTPEVLRSVVPMNPTPGGTQGTCIRAGSEQLRFFVAMLRRCSASAPIQPRNNETQHWVWVCTTHYIRWTSSSGRYSSPWCYPTFRWAPRWRHADAACLITRFSPAGQSYVDARSWRLSCAVWGCIGEGAGANTVSCFVILCLVAVELSCSAGQVTVVDGRSKLRHVSCYKRQPGRPAVPLHADSHPHACTLYSTSVVHDCFKFRLILFHISDTSRGKGNCANTTAKFALRVTSIWHSCVMCERVWEEGGKTHSNLLRVSPPSLPRNRYAFFFCCQMILRTWVLGRREQMTAVSATWLKPSAFMSSLIFFVCGLFNKKYIDWSL
jgi:hypothetical protein